MLDPADVAQLRIALGLSDTAAVVGDGAQAARLVLEENFAISLAGGLWLRRARVMDRWRIEVVGAGAQRAAFQALGCGVEIINYTPRVFVPLSEPAVLNAILARWPAQSLLPAAA